MPEDNGCGQPSASSKLTTFLNSKSHLYEQLYQPDLVSSAQEQSTVATDKEQCSFTGVEYFEFKDSNTSIKDDWKAAYLKAYTRPHLISNQTSSASFPESFEAAFARHVALDSNETRTMSSYCPWATEFTTRNHNHVSNATNLSAENNAQWISQFMRDNSTVLPTDASATSQDDTVGEWVKEFTSTNDGGRYSAESTFSSTDNIEMQSIAQSILANLELSLDPKLANSRFVAYLRDLANGNNEGSTNLSQTEPSNCPISSSNSTRSANFQEWKESFLQNIAPITNSEEQSTWQQLHKTWDEYEATGYGYKNFARREFARYQFSRLISANPFSTLTDTQLREMRDDTRQALADRLLAAELIVYRYEKDAVGWKILAQLQQANEMDAQAIGAFWQATLLTPSDAELWLDLAASCANETCLADALVALRKVSENEQNGKNVHHLASAILHSINGEPDKAIPVLRAAIADNTFKGGWSLRNRLAATLANAHQYNEALNIYEELLREGYDYPRIHYNQGIALLSQDRYEEAARCLVRAIDRQLPVDIVEGNVREELLPSYKSPWEALRVNFSLWGQEQFVKVDIARLPEVKRFLRMD